MGAFLRREPVILASLVGPLLTALLAFGVLHWTVEEAGAVSGLVIAGGSLFARQQVTPTASLPPTITEIPPGKP